MSLDIPRTPPQPQPRTVQLDTERLYGAIDRKRRVLRISQREVLRQMGEFGPSALTRLGQGRQPSADLLIRMLVWLGATDLAPYISLVEPNGEAEIHIGRQM